MTNFCISASSKDGDKIAEAAIIATILFAFETGFREASSDGSKKNYDLTLCALKETIQDAFGLKI